MAGAAQKEGCNILGAAAMHRQSVQGSQISNRDERRRRLCLRQKLRKELAET